MFEDIREALKEKYKIDIENFKPILVGSKVKKSDIEKFTIKELTDGIEVEFEHTSDPMVALEIALIHLNEGKNYYVELDKMEKKLVESFERIVEALLDEEITTGDVSTMEVRFGKHDMMYRNKPSFNLSKEEFQNLVRKKEVPERCKLFARANKTTDVYMIHPETKLAFRLDKYFSLN